MDTKQDHFRINVAKADGCDWTGQNRSYVHLFATNVVGEPQAIKAYREINARFPYPEFKVDVTEWKYRGTERLDFTDGRLDD